MIAFADNSLYYGTSCSRGTGDSATYTIIVFGDPKTTYTTSVQFEARQTDFDKLAQALREYPEQADETKEESFERVPQKFERLETVAGPLALACPQEIPFDRLARPPPLRR